MKQADVTLKHILAYVLPVVCSLVSLTAFAQAQTVAGKVTDSETGLPIVGVVIAETGGRNTTVSQTDGSFSIRAASPQAELTFTCLGYARQTVSIANRAVINVSLDQAAEKIDDVIVVGYGTQKKISLTGSVGQISADDIANRSVPSAAGLLQGKIPGLTVVQKSSQPGAPEVSIRIRGDNTMGSNDPLILIDGFPGDIGALNPNDVESVTVLKDAATAAIYGVRAAAGVILYTTKSGRKEQPITVDFSGYYGFQTPTRLPEFLGARDYMVLRNEALKNVNQPAAYTQTEINAIGTSASTYPDTDWVGEIYQKVAPIANYNVTARGGTSRSSYTFSYGHLSHEGIPIADRYSQTKDNIRASGMVEAVKERLILDGSITYDIGINNTPASGNNPIYHANMLSPLEAIKNSWGNYVSNTGNRNPIADIKESGQSTYDWYNAVVRGGVKVNILTGWSARGTYSALRAKSTSKVFTKKYELYDTKDNILVNTNVLDAKLDQGSINNMANTLTLQTDFNRTFGLHTVTAVLGMEQENAHYESFSAHGERFATANIQTLNASEHNYVVNGYENHYALRSWFLRVAENYKNKYFIEALVRQDMTSRFAKENRVGTFYAFSASWRLLEESFISSLRGNTLNELKLRASFGSVGNQNVSGDLYPYISQYHKFNSSFVLGHEETPVYAQMNLPNTDIQWEVSDMLNVGLDIGMFNDRLNISADGWRRRTSKILVAPTLPSVLGLGSANINGGIVDSWGWELSLRWAETRNGWSYSFEGMVSDARNKVFSLYGSEPVKLDALRMEGYEIDALYGFHALRLAQESDFTYNPVKGYVLNSGIAVPVGAVDKKQINPGDILYADTDGNGYIDDDDRVVIGSIKPRYTYSLTGSLAWKGIDLYVFLQGVGKCDGYIYSEAIHAFTNDYSKPQKIHLDRWTKTNPDASYPRLSFKEDYNQSRFSDYWLQNAAYLRLKNVAIGYTLPHEWTAKAKMQKVRIYVSAENLLTISDYFYAYDPETILNNGSYYPQLRTFYIGANITF